MSDFAQPPPRNPSTLDKVVAEVSERRRLWKKEHPDSAEPLRLPEKSVPSSAPHTSGAAYRRISDVEASPISWYWRGKLARGKVSLIVGHPGLAKSTLALSI